MCWDALVLISVAWGAVLLAGECIHVGHAACLGQAHASTASGLTPDMLPDVAAPGHNAMRSTLAWPVMLWFSVGLRMIHQSNGSVHIKHGAAHN